MNVGMVDVSVLANVENDDFAIAQIGEPFLVPNNRILGSSVKATNKKVGMNWDPLFRGFLQPGFGLDYCKGNSDCCQC